MITKIATIGSTTDHGGVITTGNSNFLVNNKKVSCLGDTHNCPIHGINTIVSACVTRLIIDGKPVAHIGSICGCGAVINSGEDLKVGD